VTRVASNTAARVIAALCLGIVRSGTAAAQSYQRGDSLLAVGDVVRAESAYYAAARLRPRDPAPRLALGRFLVERGATRVGATLLEESLKFGGDPVLVGRELMRAYLRMYDFAPLAALPAASPAQRERARWLVTHEPRIVAPDSVLSALFSPGDDANSLGNVAVRVNGVALTASLSAQVQGVVVSRAAMGDRRPKLFTGGADSTGDADLLAVADSVGIGSLTLINQPVTLSTLPPGTQALIGLSELGRFAPTVDPKSGKLTLRAAGDLRDSPAGERLTTLDHAVGVFVLRDGVWIASPAGLARLLRDREWTFDARRGSLIVDR
jgi:hypothetical protein